MQNSTILKELNVIENMSSEPWPEDAILYQPYEAEQILLPEHASCLAVKTYLQMCKLPVEVRPYANAEFMSPGGRMTKLPVVRVGAFIVSEFEPIVKLVEQKNASIGQWMDEDERADMRTYVSLVENLFTMAELYISFVDRSVYDNITAPRNSCVYPWPLGKLQNFRKRRNALRILKVYQWNEMTLDDVIEKVEKCCETLSTKLKTSGEAFFYGSEPCELDAVAFGHLFAILTTNLPNLKLAETVKDHQRLVEFCQHIDEVYFKV